MPALGSCTQEAGPGQRLHASRPGLGASIYSAADRGGDTLTPQARWAERGLWDFQLGKSRNDMQVTKTQAMASLH